MTVIGYNFNASPYRFVELARPAPAAPVAPAARPTAAETPPPKRQRGVARSTQRVAARLHDKHAGATSAAKNRLTPGQVQDVAAFKKNFETNKARYDAVAARTNMPASLVAALHWRESHGNFETYMHNGDPLGKPARHTPHGIPVFTKWENSAVHALGQKHGWQQALGLKKDSSDLASMASFAEIYNGLGYDRKHRPSPYVYAGTSEYASGKYVRDGHYDSRAIDKQTGVLALINSLKA